MLIWICGQLFSKARLLRKVPEPDMRDVMKSAPEKIENLDISLFQWIESQTTEEDRFALLSLQNITRSFFNSYIYLEIGSHLGGSLQPHLVDEKCGKIISIDPRPQTLADERWEAKYHYPGNSTGRMHDCLKRIPGAEINKLETIEKNSWELSGNDIQTKCNLLLIDGEHTNNAVFMDLTSSLVFTTKPSIISFHDCFIVSNGILDGMEYLRRKSISYETYYYKGSNIFSLLLFPEDKISKSFNSCNWINSIPFKRGDNPAFVFEKEFQTFNKKDRPPMLKPDGTSNRER